MECISELKDSLNAYFGWNKARMACFVNVLLALLATRTVNLSKLACVIFGEAQQASRYRQIQRFFSKFPLDYSMENNGDPRGREFLATNQDDKWKRCNILFICWLARHMEPFILGLPVILCNEFTNIRKVWLRDSLKDIVFIA